jgi:VWFA-related protein
MRVSRLRLMLPFVLSSVALLAQGQSELPQFRAGVELIQLDVAVLDDKRQPVRGLTAADFTVLDNGVATPIRAFTPVELAPRARATEAAWADEAPPDVVTNQAGLQDGRLVIILMDRSIPVHQPTVVARKIAVAAVEALGPNDLAAVVSTSNGAIQNLTSDRARLLRAINASDPSTGISREAQEIPTMGKQDPLSDGRCLCGLCVLDTVRRVADAVQSTPRRRKVLFFIGSNLILQSTRPVVAAGADVGCEFLLKDARAAMFTAVDRANLTVHSIDPQGLSNVGPQTRATTMGGEDRPIASGPKMRLEQQQVEMTETITSRQSLQVLPERTGGRAVVGRNNPEQAVPEIFGESEAYYVLGVERGTSGRTDGARSIEVKVGSKGLRVYAQRQYAAPSQPNAPIAAPVPGAPPSNADALTRLLPSAGTPLVLSVTAFASPAGAKPVVRVNVDAGAFARTDGTAVPLEIALLATDQTGRPVASARQTSTITAARFESGAPVGGQLASQEINVQSHVELAPGDYGIRVAVSDPVTGRVASVFSDVTVPTFESSRLSLSGVTVDVASPSSPAPTPTTRRVFRREDQVRAVLQIYQGTDRTDAIMPVSMRVQILDAKGVAIRDQSLPFTGQTFTNRRADCVITLPLAKLPPGEYLLRLEASMDRQTAGRALRFAVQ